MFRHSLDLGSLFGIRIRLNWSVLIIFALIVVNLAVGVFPAWHPGWSVWLNWAVALAAALVFFVSLLAHEMAHSLVALHFDLPVKSITLFLFGGVSDIQEEPETPWREIVIAAAGPLVSLGLGLAFLGLFWLFIPAEAVGTAEQIQAYSRLGATASVLGWVGAINLLLAAFNMIPALPLDGGRVFRALLWMATGDLKKSTRWAAIVARVISWGLIAAGVAMAFGIELPVLGSGLIGGLWLAVIGWFLGQSASAAYTQLLLDEALEGLLVSRFVHDDAKTVAPGVSVEQLIDDYFMGTEQTSFPVVEDGRFAGVVHFVDIHSVDQDAWPRTPVAEIAAPPDEVVCVGLEDEAAEAFKTMLRNGLSAVPVLHRGEFRGMLLRQDILKWVRSHSNLGAGGLGLTN
jgi:Zn-dependent protease/CBS domain-containing protein